MVRGSSRAPGEPRGGLCEEYFAAAHREVNWFFCDCSSVFFEFEFIFFPPVFHGLKVV